MSFCRCCLLTDVKFKDMRSMTFQYNNQPISFLEGYKFCNAPDGQFGKLLKIAEVDESPQICKMCMVQLESAYVFVNLCREATMLLEEKYPKEIDENDDTDIKPVTSKKKRKRKNPSPAPSNKKSKAIKIKQENEDVVVKTEEEPSSSTSPQLDAFFMQKRVQCKFCKRIFVTKGVGDSLWLHSFDHRSYEPYNCHENRCIYQTRLKKNFQSHLKKAHNIDFDDAIHEFREDYQSTVNYVVGIGKKLDDFDSTTASSQNNLPQKFECATCEMKFTRKIQQMRHSCPKA